MPNGRPTFKTVSNAANAKTTDGTATGRNAMKSKKLRERLRVRNTIHDKAMLKLKVTSGVTVISSTVLVKPRCSSGHGSAWKLSRLSCETASAENGWKYGS